jgi:mRNA-degrading endonuclease RelE of RelBE toxin-antitoxin system
VTAWQPIGVAWTRNAQRDLRRLPPQVADQITGAVESYARTGHADVRKLEARPEYRLRVREWRVLFTRDQGGPLVDRRVLPRGRAYER